LHAPSGFCNTGAIDFTAAGVLTVPAVRPHQVAQVGLDRAAQDPALRRERKHYDATLGGSGGYIFNRSTKGLSAGTWRTGLSIDGDSQSGYQLLFDIR
jgi:hypothetical protein